MKNITIGIPTFERAKAVVSLINSLKEQQYFSQIELLICDNHSLDGSWETLNNIEKANNITLVRNAENLGFQGNFLRVIELCKTEYLVMLSDEDDIDLGQLKLIHDEYLQDGRNTFLSPVMKIEGKIYRGEKRARILKINDFFQSSCYLSGQIYKTEATKILVDTIGVTHLTNKNQVYPQCLLVAAMIATNKKCRYIPIELTSKRFQLESRINDTASNSYEGLSGRVSQIVLFNEFFSHMYKTSPIEEEKKKWMQLTKFWATKSFGFFKIGYWTTFPEHKEEFNKGVRQSSLLYRGCRKLRSFIKF